jgi:hypothetical protein
MLSNYWHAIMLTVVDVHGDPLALARVGCAVVVAGLADRGRGNRQPGAVVRTPIAPNFGAGGGN